MENRNTCLLVREKALQLLIFEKKSRSYTFLSSLVYQRHYWQNTQISRPLSIFSKIWKCWRKLRLAAFIVSCKSEIWFKLWSFKSNFLYFWFQSYSFVTNKQKSTFNQLVHIYGITSYGVSRHLRFGPFAITFPSKHSKLFVC